MPFNAYLIYIEHYEQDVVEEMMYQLQSTFSVNEQQKENILIIQSFSHLDTIKTEVFDSLKDLIKEVGDKKFLQILIVPINGEAIIFNNYDDNLDDYLYLDDWVNTY